MNRKNILTLLAFIVLAVCAVAWITRGQQQNFPAGSLSIASGATAMGTSLIASAACATTVTVAATNVLATDTLTTSFNSNPTGVVGYQPLATGMLAILAWPSSGNVNFAVCNNTSAGITPGAITLNWKVVR